MDAAQRILRNNRYLFLIALALALAASASAQPALQATPNSIIWNSSSSGTQVAVSSTGDPISFNVATTSITPAGGQWLIAPTSGSTGTPLNLSLGNTLGLVSGTAYSATITLTPT